MTEKRFVPLPEVIRLTGLKHSSIYRRITLNDFPRPIKLGSSARWLLSEVEAWIDAQVLARDDNLSEERSQAQQRKVLLPK